MLETVCVSQAMLELEDYVVADWLWPEVSPRAISAIFALISMKAFPGAKVFMPDLDDGVMGVAMDVDVDGDALELLGDAAVDHKLFDADFFNDFEDDFDDTDLA